MKLHRQTLIAAGITGLIATATVVSVYEGGVRVVNARGDVALSAGERARVEPGSAPVRDGSASTTSIVARARLAPDATRGQLLEENDALRGELTTAQQRITALEKNLAEVNGSKPSRVDPTPEQLAEWAAKCEVHINSPGVYSATPTRLDPSEAAEWGVTKDEQPMIERALAELHGRARTEMREIYLAATGNTAGADELTANAMLSEIFDKAAPGDAARARQRMARERAGLQAPPTNLAALAPLERAYRLIFRLGNDFEHLLGESLTPARAHELRKRYDGWPGLTLNDHGCEERIR
jgi:hypothetical protein